MECWWHHNEHVDGGYVCAYALDAEAIATWLERRATEILAAVPGGYTRERADAEHRAAGLTDAVDALRAGTWKEAK